eukprot:364990-Chlamydomonas_euryale.AAC.5
MGLQVQSSDATPTQPPAPVPALPHTLHIATQMPPMPAASASAGAATHTACRHTDATHASWQPPVPALPHTMHIATQDAVCCHTDAGAHVARRVPPCQPPGPALKTAVQQRRRNPPVPLYAAP